MKGFLISLLVLISGFGFSQSSNCQITLPTVVKKVQGTYPVLIEANCQIRTVEIKVMNRWGEEIYKSNNLNHDWQGKDTPDGTYFILITGEYTSGEKISVTGYVNFIR